MSTCPLHSDSGGLGGAASPLRDLHYKGKELRRVSPSPPAVTPVEKCRAAGGPREELGQLPALSSSGPFLVCGSCWPSELVRAGPVALPQR